jgi:hypothetical protein
MRIYSKFVIAAVLVGGLVALPATAHAQSRGAGGHSSPHGGGGGAPHGAVAPAGGVAVPRPGGPVYGAGAYHYPYYGYGYGHYPYYPYYGYGYPYYRYPYGYPCCGYPYYGGVGFSVGFGWGWGSFGFSYPYYGYPYYSGYPAYGYPAPYPAYVVPGGPSAGGLRIDVAQRDAQVTVDGNYAGTVEDFNGRTEKMNLQPGTHHVEIHENGFEPSSFDVNIEPGKTITYRATLRPSQP